MSRKARLHPAGRTESDRWNHLQAAPASRGKRALAGGWAGSLPAQYPPGAAYGFVLKPRRRLRAGWIRTVAVVLAGLGFAGYRVATSSDPSPSKPRAAQPAVLPPTRPPVGAATPGALGAALEGFALQPTDFRTGFAVRLLPAGDQVHGQVTLDNCGYRFRSEAHRVARRQYEVLDAAGRKIGLSNELVADDWPGQAARAPGSWTPST